MARLLLLLILIAAGYSLYRNFINRIGNNQSHRPVRQLDTVRCRYCGVHLAAEEAIFHRGNYYCNTEHLKADQPDTD